jgi:hypothetical protein
MAGPQLPAGDGAVGHGAVVVPGAPALGAPGDEHRAPVRAHRDRERVVLVAARPAVQAGPQSPARRAVGHRLIVDAGRPASVARAGHEHLTPARAHCQRRGPVGASRREPRRPQLRARCYRPARSSRPARSRPRHRRHGHGDHRRQKEPSHRPALSFPRPSSLSTWKTPRTPRRLTRRLRPRSFRQDRTRGQPSKRPGMPARSRLRPFNSSGPIGSSSYSSHLGSSGLTPSSSSIAAVGMRYVSPIRMTRHGN